MSFRTTATGALATLILVAGCDRTDRTLTTAQAAPTIVEPWVEPVAAPNPVGGHMCVEPEVIGGVESIVRANVRLSGDMIISQADIRQFEEDISLYPDERMIVLESTDESALKTTCSTNFVVANSISEQSVPIIYSIQPNAARNDFIIRVSNIDGIQSTISDARRKFYMQVLYPQHLRQMAEAREEEQAQRERQVARQEAKIAPPKGDTPFNGDVEQP